MSEGRRVKRLENGELFETAAQMVVMKYGAGGRLVARWVYFRPDPGDAHGDQSLVKAYARVAFCI